MTVATRSARAPVAIRARAHPRGPGRDLRGDGGQRHPDLALRDGQERDGLLDGAVRRQGRDHRAGRDAAQPARRAARTRSPRSCASSAGTSLPGDVVMVNDPFAGGMHLPDIFVVKPVFRGGGVGRPSWRRLPTTPISAASSPGSMSPYAEECYQEGLRIPPLKLYSGGRPEHGVFALLAANTRVPEIVLGDFAAQLVACDTGETGPAPPDRAPRPGGLLRPGQVACSTTPRSSPGARSGPSRGDLPVHRLPRR